MIRYGIIGPGSIARKFANDILLAKDSELVAVASRDLLKAQAFANEFNVEHAFGSYEDMVQSDLIDAVYVATPHNFHKEHSILAMKNKKHVICEKPICVNSEELEEMIKVSTENNVLLMEAMWTRFIPSTSHVKKIIQEETYGKVQYMDLEFGFEISEDYPEDGRLLNPDLAGGSILDLAIYPVSTMLYLVDYEIDHIDVYSDLSDQGVDLDTRIEVYFKNGAEAFLHSSISQDLDNTGTIKLDKTDIYMKRFYHCCEMNIEGKDISTPCLGGGFVYQIEAFTKNIIDGVTENEIMTHDETRKVMKFLDLVREKAEVIYPFEKKESN